MNGHSEKYSAAAGILLGAITLSNINAWIGLLTALLGLIAAAYSILAANAKRKFYNAEREKLLKGNLK